MATLAKRIEAIRADQRRQLDFRSSTWRDWDLLVNRHATDELGGLHFQARAKGYVHMVVLRFGAAINMAKDWPLRSAKLDLYLWMEEHIKGLYTIRTLVTDSETTAAKEGDCIFFFKRAKDAKAFEAYCNGARLTAFAEAAPAEAA